MSAHDAGNDTGRIDCVIAKELIILEGESDFTIRMFADGSLGPPPLTPSLPPPPPAAITPSHDQMEDVLNQYRGADPSTFSKTNHVGAIRRTISSDVRRGHPRFLQRLHTSSYRKPQPFSPLLLPRGAGGSAGRAAL